jgi:hypothetical protein
VGQMEHLSRVLCHFSSNRWKDTFLSASAVEMIWNLLN